MGWFFLFFCISGFCSLLYEIIWLRLAMAQFGVTTALISLVLSTFMAGLAFGSWAGGRFMRSYRGNFPALGLYAGAEFLIAISAIVVPHELVFGRNLLENSALNSSLTHYIGSGVWIALSLIPWCTCMGATIPIAMAAIKQAFPGHSQRSFSYLYLGNLLGAVFGAILPVLLIELYGFSGTLKIAAVLNSLLAMSALTISLWHQGVQGAASSHDEPLPRAAVKSAQSSVLLLLLFATGLSSMGMEVVWIRMFTPYLGTVVYSFALILGLYLASTCFGSRAYRQRSRKENLDLRLFWSALTVLALLPCLTASPNFYASGVFRLILGIGPFSAVLGFVTPMLVDRWSGGEPDRAGKAYAVNVVGCIMGPLVSGFLLMPLISERWVLFALSLPFLAAGILSYVRLPKEGLAEHGYWHRYAPYAGAFVVLLLLFDTKSFEEQFPRRVVLRDNTATIIATGEGRNKRLLVNGVGITFLTPITKMMAHLPLVFLDHPPRNSLAVCFGMGTSYRSLLSWGTSTTAVELVPSVPRLFSYYHPDSAHLLASSLSRVVLDDGRRYLERTPEHFDVITVDPPPPVHAAGSSLLYSKEFYSIARHKLSPGGILQQWLPEGDPVIQASVARALKESFPYVRGFRSVEGWGFHFLASSHPLTERTAAELVQNMPSQALKDLIEWGPEPTAERQFALILQREFPLDRMLEQAPNAPAIQDDQPANEYYALRSWNVLVRQFLNLDTAGTVNAVSERSRSIDAIAVRKP